MIQWNLYNKRDIVDEIKIKDPLSYESFEDDIHKKISKDRFFAILKDSKIELSAIYGIFKIEHETLKNFNYVIKKIKETITINIYEMVLFLDEGGYKQRKTLSILDKINKNILRTELSLKYNRKNKDILDDTLITNNK